MELQSMISMQSFGKKLFFLENKSNPFYLKKLVFSPNKVLLTKQLQICGKSF
jgi:hypothetical protein